MNDAEFDHGVQVMTTTIERHFPLWKIWEHSECKNAGLKNVLS